VPSIMRESEDPRIQKTKILLFASLAEALEEKDFVHITVKDICETANVNRSTFYRHYEDKLDLLRRGSEELFDKIILDSGVDKLIDAPPIDRVRLIFLEIERSRDLLKPFFLKNADSFMGNKLKEEAYLFFLDKRIKLLELDENEARGITTLICSAFIGIVKDWVMDETSWSLDEVTSIYERFIIKGVSGFSEKV